MAEGIWVPSSAGIISLAGTSLNSLANNSGQLLTTGIDNTAKKYWYTSFEFLGTFASAPTLGGGIHVFAAVSQDGTNYEDTVNGASPVEPSWYLGFMRIDARTTAQRQVLANCPLPGPFKLKVYGTNKTGQALPSSVTFSAFDFTDGT